MGESWLRLLSHFLSRFEIVHLSEAASIRAVALLKRYRLSHGLLVPDGLIAATALVADLELVSKNQKDYWFIEGLRLLPYPS